VVSNPLLAIAQTIPQTPTLEQITAVSPFIPHLEALAEDLAQSPAGESFRQTYLRQRQASIQDEDIIWIFTGLGWFYQGQGDYGSAEPCLEQCVEVVKSRLGERQGRTGGDRHPPVASSLNNLAGLYYYQGRYELAEPLYEEALAIAEERLGTDHPNTVTMGQNLAILQSNRPISNFSLSQRGIGICKLIGIILGIILLPFYLLWLGLRWLMRRRR
jgi:tetratricopeptide (TPR) repeat protein